MRIAVCLLILACLAGCSAKDKVPSDIIPRDQMSSYFMGYGAGGAVLGCLPGQGFGASQREDGDAQALSAGISIA